MEGIVIGDNGLSTDAEGVMHDGGVCVCVGDREWKRDERADAVEVEWLVQEFVEVGETTVIGKFDWRHIEAEGGGFVARAIGIAFEAEETEEGRREEEAVDEGAAWLGSECRDKIDHHLPDRVRLDE